MVAAGFSLRLFAQPVVAGFSLRLKTIDFLSSTQPEGCDYKLRLQVAATNLVLSQNIFVGDKPQRYSDGSAGACLPFI